jgi:hypothetical protein
MIAGPANYRSPFSMEPPLLFPISSQLRRRLPWQNSPDHTPSLPSSTASPASVLALRRFTIGLTSRENSVTTYHLHLSEDEARRFAAFIAERVEFDYVQLMR